MGELAHDEVDIAVETCGFCHSDLSMKNNDWGISEYPFVGGHEVVGRVIGKGAHVSHLEIGQRIGLGWYSRSCGLCDPCMRGDQNICVVAESAIVTRHGGFANKVRAQAFWCTPIPDALDLSAAGPLFCGGITVFNLIVQNAITALDHVAVVGIGGLGNLALQFLSAWGCEVTAISTSESKFDEAKALGATHFLHARDPDALKAAAGRFKMILVTVNVPLDWDLYMTMLDKRGKLHIVGAVPSVTSSGFPLIEQQKIIGGSPLGSPGLVKQMLDFCARKEIAPVTQKYALSQINTAFENMEAGKARYRLVLENDISS
ncbi:MAG: alcohol dehydrogenase catalytic domain-containing protein [Verrucomicrobiaceae bacterium]|nr:alcohol dehydrogenase catalytic domain-containing protein [Verrucomicrobiaceae bacterium]